MSVLYLFGNGFDIAHGIRTPYSALRSFLEAHHESFLTRFESVYNIEPLDDTEPWYTENAQKQWNKRVLKDLWAHFEEEIGFPNVDEMHDRASSLVDSMPQEGVKDTLDYYWRDEYGFARELQTYVLEWLESIDVSGASCRKDCLINANSDFFINFNYTDTLERVYGIKNVLHIHGGVPSCSEVPPIMGHGNKYIIDLYERKLRESLEEGIEWAASIYEAIVAFCKSLYKDTDMLISRNNDFFVQLRDINEIVSLGLSFGNVDVPYLARIMHEIRPYTKWKVYYYSDGDLKRLKDVFGILGITRRFEVYFLPSDAFWDR